MSIADTTRFQIRDLLMAAVFLALLNGGMLLDSRFDLVLAVPAAVLLLVWLLVVTILTAAFIQNIVLGTSVILLFHISQGLRDIVLTNAGTLDVFVTCAATFVTHAAFYLFVAFIARNARSF